MLVRMPGPPNRRAAPTLATEASRTSRRTGRTLRGGVGLGCITDSPIREIFLWVRSTVHPARWRRSPYGVLTAGLKLRKVGQVHQSVTGKELCGARRGPWRAAKLLRLHQLFD